MKHFVSAAIFALVLLCLTDCGQMGDAYPGTDTRIVWSPVIAHFKIVDSNGSDLLDPDNPDNVADKLTLTFGGETYHARFIPGFDEDKSTLAEEDKWCGLVIGKASPNWNGMPGGYWLYFGAIPGELVMDEDLVLSIEDGDKWTIHYHCSNHTYGLNPTCDRNWTIGDETTESSFFFFTVS